MSGSLDIVIAGVGGQGILLLSDIIGQACLLEGLPVRGTEVHGMAQRGGSVEAHVRVNCTYGPRVPAGRADILIGFEPLEAARYAHSLKKEGRAVVNTRPIVPPGGAADYPPVEKLLGIVRGACSQVIADDYTALAGLAGSDRAVNVVMLGVCLRFLPFSEETIRRSLELKVKPQYHPLNRKALSLGMAAGR